VTISELRAALHGNGVRESAYCLLSICGSDRYCITHQGPEWAVFYFERGEHLNERHFKDEGEACSYFLEWILRDESARRHEPAVH